MSSKAGPRAEGTDGSDWKHREKVATQYVVSVKYKNAIKRTLIYHGMLGLGLALSALVSGINSLHCWQVLWLAAFPSCAIGFRGIVKNQASYLGLYRLCLLACSIPAGLWGLLATLGVVEHYEFYRVAGLPKPQHYFMPASDYVIYFLGFTTILSHLFSLACVSKLTNAWDVTGRSRKSKGE